jgi:hypothetical protein
MALEQPGMVLGGREPGCPAQVREDVMMAIDDHGCIVAGEFGAGQRVCVRVLSRAIEWD